MEIKRSQLKKVVSGELTGTKLFIEYPDYYEEDYQIMMLRKNQIPHLLRPQLDGIGHCSRFSYEIRGKLSLRAVFEKRKISLEELKDFVEQFLETMEELREYMLRPDCLWLEPESIYLGDGSYEFCYFPAVPMSIQEQFHKLTEYFVEQIDYTDVECIMLAHKLNRGTLEEQCDIAHLMREYEKEAKERHCKEIKKREDCFSVEEPENESGREYEREPLPEIETEKVAVKSERKRERKKSFSSIRHMFARKKWGKWQDLLLESENDSEWRSANSKEK